MTESGNQNAVGRPVVVTAVLLVAAAVLLVALRSWFDRPSTVDDEADALVAAPQEASAAITAAETDDELAIDTTAAEAAPAISAQSSPPAAPLKIVLLPARSYAPDPAAQVLADSVRQVTIRTLRGMVNVEVIDLSPAELATVVPSIVGPERSEIRGLRETSRQYGGATAAQIAVLAFTDGACWGVNLDVFSQGGSASISTRFPRNGDARPANDSDSIGIRYAEAIAAETPVRDAAAASRTATRNVLIDPTRPEDARMAALTTLRNQSLDSESAAAAVELAARSASPEARAQIWRQLRGIDDAALAQPMSIALQTDPDAAVRLEAALGLKRYLDAEGIEPALAQAALGDPSADVRLAARMATMDAREERDFILETLLDLSLTPAERVAPTSMSPNPLVFRSPEDAGGGLTAAMRAFAEIISGTDDPDIDLKALSALQRTLIGPGLGGTQQPELDPALTRALIEAAASTDERIRRSALYAMRRFADDREIRAVLESVLETDLRLANELGIATAIAQPQGSNVGAPPRSC